MATASVISNSGAVNQKSTVDAVKPDALSSTSQVSATDQKTYLFVIGRILQVIALVGVVATIAVTCVAGPIALIGLIGAVALGLIGSHIADKGQVAPVSPPSSSTTSSTQVPSVSTTDSTQQVPLSVSTTSSTPQVPPLESAPQTPTIPPLAPPLVDFVPGQPVGLVNCWLHRSGGKPFFANNCWLNSSLQFLAHIPVCEARMRQIPQLDAFLDSYEAVRAGEKFIAMGINTQKIRRDLRDQGIMPNAEDGLQCDAAEFVGKVLEGRLGQHAFHQLTEMRQVLTDQHGLVQLGDLEEHNVFQEFIAAKFGEYGNSARVNLQDLFAQEFLPRELPLGTSDEARANSKAYRRLQNFFPQAPADIIIQAARFQGSGLPGDPLKKIHTAFIDPQTIRVTSGMVMDRVNATGEMIVGQGANYVCDSFVIHRGDAINSGHYEAYIQRDGEWWRTDDERITQVTPETALAAMAVAYILHYARLAEPLHGANDPMPLLPVRGQEDDAPPTIPGGPS